MLEAFPAEPYRLLAEDGTLMSGASVTRSPAQLRELWQDMTTVREFDRKLITLLRQGRTTFYAQASGMEATQIGIARGIRAGHDWIWGYYRDHGIALGIGVPIEELVAQMLGANTDPNRGRQMPHHPGSRSRRFVSSSSSIANQVPPAAGMAMAQRYLGTDEVTICTFGDGATSEGDWHAGVNMAAVNDAPCLFICENNQWAISTAVHHQTRSESIHIKARAYGIPGYYVDGNDVLAVQEAVSTLTDQMRAGGGPVLLECLTYRVGSHSNADADAEKTYRSRDEVKSWTGRDPIVRLERFMASQGLEIGAEERAAEVTRIHSLIDSAVQKAEESGQPDWRIMFEDVYGDLPVHLRWQYDHLRAEQLAGQEGTR
ncbi:thiamine pyrophosphate-dependent dehydrogenase E1 component subunit alpha [Deinococcus sp. KNUC1210]|uniref:thiamine pyrophosphate-dependent dehydrogenase E1 component subunit alpha n=1 Tax=Deinococcus sp. KNUC1210 TaxID=2917691 RepID=UPI001EF14916|nr:thiamine pyrophosphate-dependent dehydrogenase E1 component subunit alpha [Deinococcus sp. KNUC1210]ULH14715.1 thiamine pyrophosphate-dependent dehydrogenase E1 component subunit alpha [Deinococcus sp. KNUC1210]